MEPGQRKEYEGYVKYAFGLTGEVWDFVVDYRKPPKTIASKIILEEEMGEMDEDTLKMIERRTGALLKKRLPDEIDLFTGRLTEMMLAKNPFLPENPSIWSIIDSED